MLCLMRNVSGSGRVLEAYSFSDLSEKGFDHAAVICAICSAPVAEFVKLTAAGDADIGECRSMLAVTPECSAGCVSSPAALRKVFSDKGIVTWELRVRYLGRTYNFSGRTNSPALNVRFDAGGDAAALIRESETVLLGTDG